MAEKLWRWIELYEWLGLRACFGLDFLTNGVAHVKTIFFFKFFNDK